MKSSIFVFGTDLLHEGYDAVLDNFQHRAGVDTVSLSATYHHARDVFAHNPRHTIYRHQGDIAWFRPNAQSYGILAPRLADDAQGEDVLARLCDRAARRGLDVQAWTIFTHNSWLASQNPDCATRNVYGDAYWTDLCPAHPLVQDYARNLAADLTRYPVRRLLAESLHYRPFEHGDHHERYLIRIPPAERRLLSLCFCPSCRAAGTRAGLDMTYVAQEVQAALAPTWEGHPHSDEGPLLSEATQLMLDRYDDVRTGIIADLVADVRGVLNPKGVELSFMDHAGAMHHVMPGTSADGPVADPARRLGIDLAKVAQASDEITALGYVDTPERLAALLASYRRLTNPDTALAVALRPLMPDCTEAAVLADKVAIARKANASRIDFYHYAMMPLERLDWIASALSAHPSA